jgi:hypothetical protein
MSHDYTELLARLDESLPKADERESVWCSVQGHDLRAAVQAIAALVAENAGWKAGYENLMRDNDTIKAQLRAERDAAVVDALRYRWLRDNRVDENGDGEKCIYFWCDFEHYDDVDAAIDAARQPTAPGAR